MRLVQYKENDKEDGEIMLGIEIKQDGDIIQLEGTMQDLINGGSEGINVLKSQMDLEGTASQLQIIQRSKVKLVSPITSPSKIIGIGLNYKDGAAELGKEEPKFPIVFLKLPSTISGTDDVLPLPSVSKQVDWEVELAVVIGKHARNVSENDALDYVFGYTVGIDYTARDLMARNGGLWTLAKNFAGFSCLGPALVTKDEIIPFNLKLETRINGVVKQQGSTANMIFGISQLIAYLSKHMDLEPGDVILTGTPAGLGVARSPQEFIKLGDKIECSVAGIGTLRNTATVDRQ